MCIQFDDGEKQVHRSAVIVSEKGSLPPGKRQGLLGTRSVGTGDGAQPPREPAEKVAEHGIDWILRPGKAAGSGSRRPRIFCRYGHG